METSIKYEDREQLYESLVKDLNLKKLEEVYNHHAFGNYFITFSAGEFLIRYVNDRLQLFIYVASNAEPSKWYDLSFIKNYITKASRINVNDENNFTLKSILLLNDFLKGNFDKIAELLNRNNYKNTFSRIDALLIKEHKINFPGAIEE
ncbi:MAG: hypothetical protein JWQ66_1243 [Mucilaginibacter sp.]|nr:hypothetical protein [Mucilaginibacter sp.]